jgi:uncharacterized tellurite resistance protein B-like protein
MAADKDPRVAKAKRVLKRALADGEKAEAEATNRATATRALYKCGFTGAKEALEVLNEKV